MINISTEDGLTERLERWEDVTSRPKFVANVDADAAQLKHIMGNYEFDAPVLCGLAGCRQPHGKGYLVQLKDGRETNLGKDCGKKYFGDVFRFAKRRYDSARRDQENRLSLSALQNQLPQLRQRVMDIRQGQFGADWAHKLLQKLLQRGYGLPDALVTEIGKLVRARNPRVMRDRLATKEELDQLEAAAVGERRLPRPYYIQEPAGTIDGLPALYAENSLRDLLVVGITVDLDQIEGKDVSSLASKDLTALSKRTSDLEARFTRAEQSLAEARKLLRQSNLRLLEVRLTESRDRQGFADFLKTLPL